MAGKAAGGAGRMCCPQWLWLHHSLMKGMPALQGWVLDTLPKPLPSPASTFPLHISLALVPQGGEGG